jgi:ribosomal protein S18 acetylase RimI-like enzyme
MIVARTNAEWRLVDISLFPEHRGRGSGTVAIRELIREASDRGLPLRLSVLRTNRAQRLYQRLGFVAKGGDAMYIEMEYTPSFFAKDPECPAL